MLTGSLLIIIGIALVLWGAERFTDGAVGTAAHFSLSTFYVGALISGFEPENLVTGVTAAAENLHQIALGTVIGSAIFMLTAGLGVTLLLVPMAVQLPRAGSLAMLASIASFAVALWTDGTVSRVEGAMLLLVAVSLLMWLYWRSPIFRRVSADEDDDPGPQGSRLRAVALLVLGVVVMLVGAELLVQGVRSLLGAVMLSETFLGMVVVGMGESLEETARMVTPARRGHPELAWGNVVGSIVVLVTFNLGVIALVRPITADPLVLRLHAPYLLACTVVVAVALLGTRTLGRAMGAVLVGLLLLYLAFNVSHIWG